MSLREVSNTINYELPVHFEAEQICLGYILANPTLLESLLEQSEADVFFDSSHRMIFDVMEELFESGEPVDFVTVTTKLKNRNEIEIVGGPSYLKRLHDSVPSSNPESFKYYVGLLNQQHLLRRVVRAGIQQIKIATEDRDVDQAFLFMQKSLDILSDRAVDRQEFRSLSEAAMDYFEELEARAQNQEKGYLTGVPSGFEDLDKMTSGFQKGDLVIVAARPGVGKTAFALNVAMSASKDINEPTAIFSLEMSEPQLVQRIISSEGHVDGSRLRTGKLEEQDWYNVVMSISGMGNVYLDDTPGINVAEIRAKCRRLKKRCGLGLIIIDYLQLISGSRRSENRQQEVSEISRTLKLIAKELNVPVIALSQLSRSVEQRQDKRPMLSDLRESGSIEQDADIVAFLYRDDYYNQESEKKNLIEIIIAKQRNGPIGTVELVFLKQLSKFVNYELNFAERAN
ncbi:replicative DNA helicase [Paenibacillus woosongensis]|uniref:Replicative DNA helicase n=1 Tax=Paenibacillus woosongensis TaxID=307580 RepID=A0ABQ4MZ07_9BACL|nr:replicative DNA helicase [Paenibacillus woosongensis]GIP61151.1 replicative DNA helicase [Paenibacillus woosongensis]